MYIFYRLFNSFLGFHFDSNSTNMQPSKNLSLHIYIYIYNIYIMARIDHPPKKNTRGWIDSMEFLVVPRSGHVRCIPANALHLLHLTHVCLVPPYKKTPKKSVFEGFLTPAFRGLKSDRGRYADSRPWVNGHTWPRVVKDQLKAHISGQVRL